MIFELGILVCLTFFWQILKLLQFSSKLSHLSSSSQKELMQLIGKYSSLFSDVPTVTNVLEHDIDVGDNRPVKQNAYRINPVKREIMQKEMQYLIQHGLDVPSSSPWCSPSHASAPITVKLISWPNQTLSLFLG